MSNEQRFGMLIDLSTCIGCNACTVACKQENEVPLTKFNVWVDSWDAGTEGDVRRANVPKQCNHCESAPCVKVCPTGASYRTEEGTVMVDPERCIGCKYCMAACPYQVRWVNEETGEVGKCTFCHHRTVEGLLPACVSTCVTQARIFGDLNDPESDISRRLAAEEHEVFMPELGLEPSLFYVGLSKTLSMPVTSAIHRGGNVVKHFEG